MKNIHIAIMSAIATAIGFIVELQAVTNFPSSLRGLDLLAAQLAGFFKCLGVGLLYGAVVGITALIIKAVAWPNFDKLVTWILTKINQIAIVVMIFAMLMGAYGLLSGK